LSQPASTEVVGPPGCLLHSTLPCLPVVALGDSMTDFVDQQSVTLVRVGVLDHDLSYPPLYVAMTMHSSP
jgi:hypothetical protein